MKKLVFVVMMLISEWSVAGDYEDNLKAINDAKIEQNSSLIRPRIKLSRMPTTIGSPSYSEIFTRFGDVAKITFWRELIDGKIRLFVAVNVISEKVTIINQQSLPGIKFNFCPGGGEFSIFQDTADYFRSFAVTLGDSSRPFCGSINVGEQKIFVVEQWGNYKNFQELGEFKVSYLDNVDNLLPDPPANYTGSLTVPADPSFSGIYSDQFDIKTGILTLPEVKSDLGTYSSSLLYKGNNTFVINKLNQK